jgi:hypothetical protein
MQRIIPGPVANVEDLVQKNRIREGWVVFPLEKDLGIQHLQVNLLRRMSSMAFDEHGYRDERKETKDQHQCIHPCIVERVCCRPWAKDHLEDGDVRSIRHLGNIYTPIAKRNGPFGKVAMSDNVGRNSCSRRTI